MTETNTAVGTATIGPLPSSINPQSILQNFDGDFEELELRPFHPDEVDWIGRWHLKITYELLRYWLPRMKDQEIRSVRTVAILLKMDPTQAWRHLRALEKMGLIRVVWGQWAAWHEDAEPSVVTLAYLLHHRSRSVRVATSSTGSTEPNDPEVMQQTREAVDPLDPFAADYELWRPSRVGARGREVAAAAGRVGPASINTLAKEAKVSWHATRLALRKLAAVGMAVCVAGLWTITLAREVTSNQYQEVLDTATELGVSDPIGARALLAKLARCRVAQCAHDLRIYYAHRIRNARAEYKQGPSAKWIRPVEPGRMFRGVRWNSKGT